MTHSGDAVVRIAVIIPCFRVSGQVLAVLRAIPSEVSLVFCIDDACPEGSGTLIEQMVTDPRVTVIRHRENQGVGGAMITGYQAALRAGATIMVKIDGDGQMDPRLLPRFVGPIINGHADYTKGNRFFRMESLQRMPRLRLLGNAVLSFANKLSTGYWSLFDPTNGYTALHMSAAALVPWRQLSRRYFFESDLLFRLGTIRAVAIDIPMDAVYEGAPSSLRPLAVVPSFVRGHVRNAFKRIMYTYFLRDFGVASLLLLFGVPLLTCGVTFGAVQWMISVRSGVAATSGTVMLAALPVVIGIQSLLSVVSFDMANSPSVPISQLVGMEHSLPSEYLEGPHDPSP